MAGDLVQVQLDVEIFKIMQNEEHGGWNDRMAMVISLFKTHYTHMCDCNFFVAVIVCWSSWQS